MCLICVCFRELLGREEYWPILLASTCIPAFLQLLILPWFPESPRYLLIDKGDEEGCKKGKLNSAAASICWPAKIDFKPMTGWFKRFDYSLKSQDFKVAGSNM